MNNDRAPEPLCNYLEWDSKFFQRRIARLNACRLDEDVIGEALQWCGDNRIDCLYFLSDPGDSRTRRLAESKGFQLVDVRVTFGRRIEQTACAPTSASLRMAREDDVPALRAIARVSHRDSRFYFDGHFDRAKCDLLYETWIENSFRGFAQAVLVAEHDGVPVAYLTCHCKEQESQIGLVGVSADHQGKGLGSMLVQSFLNWSHEHAAETAKVVTQARNAAAHRLYKKHGFIVASE